MTIALAFLLFRRTSLESIAAPLHPDTGAERGMAEEAHLREEALARYEKLKREDRQKDLVDMLVWGALSVGSFLWFNEDGTNDFAIVSFFVCTFLFLKAFMKVLK